MNDGAPDHRPGIFRVLHSAGRCAEGAWKIELFGAPIDFVDRQYLRHGNASVLLTGFATGLRLSFAPRPRSLADVMFEVSIDLSSLGGATGPADERLRWVVPGTRTSPIRTVLWRRIRLDPESQARAQEAFHDEGRSGGLLLTSDSRAVRLLSGTRIGTQWRVVSPGCRTSKWRERGSRWYEVIDGEPDDRANVGRILSLPTSHRSRRPRTFLTQDAGPMRSYPGPLGLQHRSEQ